MFNKQYDTDHKIQRLYIHWDVSTKCNFMCSYCYARAGYGEEWNKLDTWNRQLLIIRNIKNSTLPVFLGLLGGEPTLHPRYSELIERCHDAISNKPDGRLYITTNGSKGNEWFEKHAYFSNTYFLWSVHFEYEKMYGENFSTLLNNIKIMKDKGFKNKVNIMLVPDKTYWPKIHYIADKLEELDVELHPHFLYNNGDVHEVYDYNEEFFEEFKRFEKYKKYLVFESDTDKKIFNDYTIFHNKFTSFTGWKCWNNNYEISYNGDVRKFCFNEKDSLIHNFNYFKNIKEITPGICPHSSCNCDGLLKIYKEK